MQTVVQGGHTKFVHNVTFWLRSTAGIFARSWCDWIGQECRFRQRMPKTPRMLRTLILAEDAEDADSGRGRRFRPRRRKHIPNLLWQWWPASYAWIRCSRNSTCRQQVNNRVLKFAKSPHNSATVTYVTVDANDANRWLYELNNLVNCWKFLETHIAP